jgi:iron complex transport system ATP-binding protein
VYQAVGITVAIGKKKLLDEVDLGLVPGRVAVLIGPNGAGKSTLLKVIAGELRPAAGRINLDGRAIDEISAAELARRRAVLAQSVTLAFPFAVDEVVRLGLPPNFPRARSDTLVTRALDAVGLLAEADRSCLSLSGGEQQRAHLARVLVQLWSTPQDGRARYLLLDEPTASLDLAHQLLVMRLARAHAASGGGVLAVMHDLNLAAMLADEIVVLDKGRLVASGSPSQVVTDRLMSEVYGVDLRVGAAPPGVFVLPQTAAVAPVGFCRES